MRSAWVLVLRRSTRAPATRPPNNCTLTDQSISILGGWRPRTYTTLRAAAVQLNATEDVDRNLETADRLTRKAAEQGAQLVVLPEKWTVLGRSEVIEGHAETLDGPAVTWARNAAKELGIDLIAGSFVERRAGQDKTSNTSLHIAP